MRHDGKDLVFPRADGGAFTPSAVRKRASADWQQANEAEGKGASAERREPRLLAPITLHECRHTFASLMIAAGVNAKALSTYMGHANISITLDRYGHLMPGNEDEAAELARRLPGAGQQSGSDGAAFRLTFPTASLGAPKTA